MTDKEAPASPVIPQLTFIRFPAVVWIAIFHYGAAGFPLMATAVVGVTVLGRMGRTSYRVSLDIPLSQE